MTAERPLVVWLGDLDRGRVAEVGGKNASLGEMLRHLAGAGIHVPDGFATTAAAYWRFVDANDLRERIAGTLEDLKRGRLPLANTKPRLRMTTLFFVANSLNYLVAGTGNRSEIAIGYYTKYGDGGVDLLPIGKLLKSEVRAMARELDVPERVITKAPSAGLWLGQTDEQEMGFTYADLEHYLMDGPDAVSPALAMRIERLMRTSDHKRTVAPTPDV